MKKILLLLLILFVQICFAQSPQSFKYQAVVRDAAGGLAVNKIISIKSSVLLGSPTGSSVYTETQTLSTNDFGVVSLNIGAGAVVSGTFSAISWGAGTYFVKTELDINGGSTYVFMGTSQMLSVPYALYAEKTGSSVSDFDTSPTNEIQSLSVTANSLSISNGNTITLPPDADSNPVNEIQNLQLIGDSLKISGGNAVKLTGTLDLDASPTNEIQTLSINGGNVSISNSNSILLPDSSDINEIQTITKTGNTISLSKGGGSIIDSNTTYSAGNGVSITGTVISTVWSKNNNDIYSNNSGAVGIGTSTPNASAKLDISSTTQGVLIPRLTSAQRDAISNPSIGLQIFNTTTNCLNFWIGTNWQELCGQCTPPASIANAGVDQLLLPITSTTLNGNSPIYGIGTWSIISGNGGNISNPNSPNSNFTGITGTLYKLQWKITNACTSNSDTVTISFNGPIPIVCGSDTIWVSPIDNSGTVVWSNPVNFGGNGATSLTNGENNTNIIVAAFGSGSYAANVCYNLVSNGFSDWYLPAKDELNCITQNNTVGIGLNLSTGISYWSSTESPSGSNPNLLWAYGQTISQPAVLLDKSQSYTVRCIRKNP